MENVVYKTPENIPDYYDKSITQNTRVAYQLQNLDNIKIPSLGRHPNNIILLTCDAFGLLPPISKLTNKDAVFYFLLGYTSKMPGTEIGVLEP